MALNIAHYESSCKPPLTYGGMAYACAVRNNADVAKRERLIAARKRANLKQPDVAAVMDVSVPQISRWENGIDGIPSQRIPKLLEAYRATVDELFGDLDGIHSDGSPRTKVLTEARSADADPLDTGLPPVPLLGAAVGAERDDLEEHVELTELWLDEVIDKLRRPQSLASDRDAYALTIMGTSMLPRFRPGEKILVSPKATVAIGDDVVVQLTSEDDSGERVTMVLIKELVRRGRDFYELRQYNPNITFRIPSHRVKLTHKVRGVYID